MSFCLPNEPNFVIVWAETTKSISHKKTTLINFNRWRNVDWSQQVEKPIKRNDWELGSPGRKKVMKTEQ